MQHYSITISQMSKGKQLIRLFTRDWTKYIIHKESKDVRKIVCKLFDCYKFNKAASYTLFLNYLIDLAVQSNPISSDSASLRKKTYFKKCSVEEASLKLGLEKQSFLQQFKLTASQMDGPGCCCWPSTSKSSYVTAPPQHKINP